MPRKIVTNTETLEELIEKYGESNTNCNALKKVVSDLNSKIKDRIVSAKKENTDITANGWVCKLSVTDDAQFDEELLIKVLKKHNVQHVVKKKEYVDSEELERLMYWNKLDAEVLADINNCLIHKSKSILRCVKAKEETNE